jgi:hypothetical protein
MTKREYPEISLHKLPRAPQKNFQGFFSLLIIARKKLEIQMFLVYKITKVEASTALALECSKVTLESEVTSKVQ